MTSAGVLREAIAGEMKRLKFLAVSQVAGGGQKAMIWSTRTGTQCACLTQMQELHMHKGYHVPTKQTSAESSSPEWQLGVDVLLFVEQG